DSRLGSLRLLTHQGIPLTLSILIALTLLLVLCLDRIVQVLRPLRRRGRRPILLRVDSNRPLLIQAVQIILAILSVTDAVDEDIIRRTALIRSVSSTPPKLQTTRAFRMRRRTS